MTTTPKDIAWTRDMLKADLEETAEWRRRKAVEYSDDRRNLDSADEYERLAKTVKDVPDDLLVAYSEAFEDAPDSKRCRRCLRTSSAALPISTMPLNSCRPSSTPNERRPKTKTASRPLMPKAIL